MEKEAAAAEEKAKDALAAAEEAKKQADTQAGELQKAESSAGAPTPHSPTPCASPLFCAHTRSHPMEPAGWACCRSGGCGPL